VLGKRILHVLLRLRDGDEFLAVPRGVLGRHLALAVEAAVFGHPRRLEVRGKCPRQGRGAGRLGAKDNDALHEPGAHARLEELRMPLRVGPHHRGRDGHRYARRVDADMCGAHEGGVSRAVVLGREDGIGRIAEEIERVARPALRVVVGRHVAGEKDDARPRMHRLEPLGAQRPGDRLAVLLADDHHEAFGSRRGRVDEMLVAPVRRIELADDEAAVEHGLTQRRPPCRPPWSGAIRRAHARTWRGRWRRARPSSAGPLRHRGRHRGCRRRSTHTSSR
jgi:hypothetical protein